MRHALIQAAGAVSLVAGCTVLALWLGLIVGGVVLIVAAEAMEQAQ